MRARLGWLERAALWRGGFRGERSVNRGEGCETSGVGVAWVKEKSRLITVSSRGSWRRSLNRVGMLPSQSTF